MQNKFLNNNINVAIVGFGGQTKSDHLPAIENNPYLTLSAIVDPFTTDTYLDVPIFNKLSDLERSNIPYDAVVIAVPHNHHFSTTMESLQNKKHIFKEKPVALCSNDLKKLITFSTKHNLKLLINAQRRLFPHIAKAKEYLTKIGNPFLIEGYYRIFIEHPESGWRGSKDISGGGCIMDMGYHLIDMVTNILGMPDHIAAHASTEAISTVNYTAEDTATIHFSYESALQAHGTLIISRYSGPKDELLKITGSSGIVEIKKNEARLLNNNGEQIESFISTDIEKPIDHFANVLLFDSESKLSADTHVHTMKFIEACYQSISTNKSIKIKQL